MTTDQTSDDGPIIRADAFAESIAEVESQGYSYDRNRQEGIGDGK